MRYNTVTTTLLHTCYKTAPNILKKLTKNLLKRLYDEIERLEKIHDLKNAYTYIRYVCIALSSTDGDIRRKNGFHSLSA